MFSQSENIPEVSPLEGRRPRAPSSPPDPAGRWLAGQARPPGRGSRRRLSAPGRRSALPDRGRLGQPLPLLGGGTWPGRSPRCAALRSAASAAPDSDSG